MPSIARHEFSEDKESITFVLFFQAKAAQLDVLVVRHDVDDRVHFGRRDGESHLSALALSEA